MNNNTKPKEELIEWLNLDEYVRQQAFGDVVYMRVYGNKAEPLGIKENDILIVDRNRKPENGNLVIAQANTDLLIIVYRYKHPKARIFLATLDGQAVLTSNHLPIFVPQTQDYLTWAVITYILRNTIVNGGLI